jgi:hypothetical protein
MTISSMIVDTKCDAVDHRTAQTNEVLDVFSALLGKSHPDLATGIERFGYSGFKRKFLFFNLDNPSMPNTGLQIVFRCAAKKKPDVVRVRNV